MTFHTALRQLKLSLITAHLLLGRGILVMWFNKYFHIHRSTYQMRLRALGNLRLPTKSKQGCLRDTHIHSHTKKYTHTHTQTQIHTHTHTHSHTHTTQTPRFTPPGRR